MRLTKVALSQARLGFRTLVVDPSMLIADLLLGTAIPFFIQYLIWKSVFNSSEQNAIQGFTQVQLSFYFAYVLSMSRLSNGYDVIRYLSEDVRFGKFELRMLHPVPAPLQ